MAGNVTLKINGDPSGLLAAVKTAMAQIEQEAKKLKLTPGTGGFAGGAPGTAPGVKEYQQAHAKVQQAQNDRTAAEMSRTALIQKEALLVKIARQESEIAKSGKDASFWANKRLETERAINNEKKAGAILDKEAGGGGGGWKGIASSAAGILGALGGAANYIGRRPIEIAQMQASAISMGVGRQLREARTGEYTYQSMYGQDRQKAQEQASSSSKWQTAGDIGLAGAGLVAVVGSAFLTGGASLLALGAGGALLKSSFIDKGMLDSAKYSAYQSQRQAQDFTALLAASQDASPYRKDAIERFQSTAARDIGMQRALGLNDFDWKTKRGAGMGGYYGAGGYLKSQTDLGFTDEMVTAASQGILGAGGSSAMARNSGISLQAERGLGLTNANQLLGQLSGSQSIPETSKRSLIDIFSRGFDSSNFAEENRKYMQAVTEQVFKGGSTSEATAISIADLIKASVGMAAPTTRNIEAGKAAYESYKAQGSATSGYQGGINLTSAMNDPYLSQIKDPAALKEVLKEGMDIDENDPDVIELAKQLNVPGGAKELAARVRKSVGENNEKALARPKGSLGMGRRGMIGTLDPNLDTAGRIAKENMMNGDVANPYGATMTGDQAAAAMANKTTGQAGNTAIQASAKNAQISLETLAANIQKFADDALIQAKKLADAAPKGRADEANKSASDAANASFYAAHPNADHIGGHIGKWLKDKLSDNQHKGQ
jgi:hypothetical protein